MNTLSAVLIDTWCPPQGSKDWRWQSSVGTIEIVTKGSRSDASLAKVFTTMRNVLNEFSREELRSQKTQMSLFTLREVVEEQYAKYCNRYCIFARIWEIFLSIFPGRTSTWMEHRRLLRKIDESMGLVNVEGVPLFERNLIPFIKPIEKQLSEWKEYFNYKAPCRLMTAIVIKQDENVLCRLHDLDTNSGRKTFDRIYNNDNPRQFFDYVATSIKKLPDPIKGFPSSGKFTVHITLMTFAKSVKNPGEIKSIVLWNKITLWLPKSPYSEPYYTNEGYMGGNYTYASLSNKNDVFDTLKANVEDINFPEAIVDANGNFC